MTDLTMDLRTAFFESRSAKIAEHDLHAARMADIVIPKIKEMIATHKIQWKDMKFAEGELKIAVRSPMKVDDMHMVESKLTDRLSNFFEEDASLKEFDIQSVRIHWDDANSTHLMCAMSMCLCCIPLPWVLVSAIANRLYGPPFEIVFVLRVKEKAV